VPAASWHQPWPVPHLAWPPPVGHQSHMSHMSHMSGCSHTMPTIPWLGVQLARLNVHHWSRVSIAFQSWQCPYCLQTTQV
jgi:hypothetical protein